MLSEAPTQIHRQDSETDPLLPARWRWAHGLWRRRDGWIAVFALVLIGACVSAYKLSLVQSTRHVGHADEAAYVHMARSLAQGRGLEVDYVSWFFRPYTPDITRREDHWPPFVSLCAAPFVWAIGDEPWVYRLAPILIGTILLPLAAAGLAMAYSRRGYVAFVAGLLMLANISLFNGSVTMLTDVPLAMLVAAHLAALIGSARRPWLHVLAGLFAAMAYYAKGSQLVLLALYPVTATIVGGFGQWRRRWLWCGLAAGGLAIAPMLIGNYRAYGHPLHSTQNYVSGYMGLVGWEEGTYPAYWGRDLPKTSDRWNKFGARYWRLVMHNREALTRYALLGPGTREKDWRALGTAGIRLHLWLSARTPKKSQATEGECAPLEEWCDPRTALCGITATCFAALVLVGGLLALPVRGGLRLWHLWRQNTKARLSFPAEPVWPPLWRPTLALLLVCAVEWCFVVYLWEAQARFAFVFLPVTAVVAATAISRLLELPLRFVCPRWLQRWQWILGLALATVAVGLFFSRRERLTQYHRANTDLARYPYVDQPFYPTLGNWIRDHLPTAVVMTRNPWELLYHCSPTNKAVNVPLADAPTVFSIARYYRATHFVADGNRPSLVPYVRGELPGLKPVSGAPGPLFELEYDRLPQAEGKF